MRRLLNRPAQAALLALLIAAGVPIDAAARAGDGVGMKLLIKDGAPLPPGLGELKIALGVIPGRFTGRPVALSRFLIPAVVGQEFTLSRDAVARAVAADAKAAEPDVLTDGLAVKPADTRFLRMSTFVVNSQTGDVVMGGGFNGQSAGFVILAYFDRACSLHGLDASLGSMREISLDIPAAGLYWLHMERLTPEVWRVTLEDPASLLHFEAMPPTPR